jgi:hypothetical protein
MRTYVRLGLLLAAVLAILVVVAGGSPTSATGGNSITSPDTGGDVGQYTSLVLDGSGNPVVSYCDVTNGDLKVLHCGNPNCTSGNSITSPDTGGDVGWFTSLALDASGYPVVSYGHLGSDPAGPHLRVLHCGNADCTSGNSITSPDTSANAGLCTSVALDASGNPVVSYGYWNSTTENLKVLHCNDADCSGGDESIASPDTSDNGAEYTSLALDASGNPVVAYYDETNGDLKLLHCGNPNCAEPVGGIAELPEVSDSAGRNYVALAGLAAAALVALGAGGWYARRRCLR